MGWIAPAAGAVSGILGGIGGKNQQKAANAAANQAAQQAQQVEQQLLGNATNATKAYNTDYANLLPGLSSGYGADINAAGGDIGHLTSMLLQAGMDPATISSMTGVDANQIMQQAVNYMSNPQGTNLSQVGGNALQQYGNTGGTALAGATPQANAVFQSMMQHGLDPQYQQNALNQVQQGLNQNIAQIKANAQPGTNINGLLLQAQNNALQNTANLAGNLAGQNQQAQTLGAQNFLSTAGALDTQKLNMIAQQLNAAGTIDQQTMNMLQQAASGASNFNQQQFQNLGTAQEFGQNALNAGQTFLGQGQGFLNNANQDLSGVVTNQNNLATSARQNASDAAANSAASFGSAGTAIGSFFPQSRTAQPAQQSTPWAPASNVPNIGPVSNPSAYGSSLTSSPTMGIGPYASGEQYGNALLGNNAMSSALSGSNGMSMQPPPTSPLGGSVSPMTGSPTTPINPISVMNPALFRSTNYNPNNLA